jgi:hypothetical protein
MMISVALIVGAGIIVGVAAIFWNNIISYLKKAIQRVQEVIQAVILGVRVFLRKTSDGIMQITKNYSQDQETKRWKETVVRRTLNEDEVPREKRNRLVMDEEFDISEELEMKLQSA